MNSSTYGNLISRTRSLGRRWSKFCLVAVPCLLAVASSFVHGTFAVALTLLWLVVLAAASLILLGGRTRSLVIALVLLAFSWAVALLCEGALWSLTPSIPLPAEQGPVRLGFTAIALIVFISLGPLVPERDRAPNDGLVVAAALPAIAVPLAVVVVPFSNSPQSGSELRMASMLAEDAAAWASQAFATLRLGHVPTTALESEYANYPRTSAATGAVLEILTSGRPLTTHLVTATLNSVFGSWMLCAATLGMSALVVQLLLLPLPHESLDKGRIVTTLCAALIIQLAAWSLVLVLTIPQHLSLAWAGTAVAAWTVVVTAVGRAESIGLAACLAIVLTTMAASTPWPFGLIGIALAAMGFAWTLWRKSGRRAAPAIVCLAVGLFPGVVSGLIAWRSAGPTVLLSANAVGGRVPIPFYLALMLVGAVILAATAPGVAWPRMSIVTVAGGLAIGALVIFAAQVLPIATSGYARDKVTYLALLALPLALAASTPWLHRSSSPWLVGALLAGAAFVIVSLPYTRGGITWASELERRGIVGLAARLSVAAAEGRGHGRLVCAPSANQPAYNNYYCQRWLDAFSASKSDERLRNLWLDVSVEPAAAVRKARAMGLLGGDPRLVDALWLIRGESDPRFKQDAVSAVVP